MDIIVRKIEENVLYLIMWRFFLLQNPDDIIIDRLFITSASSSSNSLIYFSLIFVLTTCFCLSHKKVQSTSRTFTGKRKVHNHGQVWFSGRHRSGA